MKKIVVLGLLSLSLMAQSTYYNYVGDESLGVHFKKSLFSFLSKRVTQFTKNHILNKHAIKKVSTNTVYYPDGWYNLKVYKPAGVRMVLRIYTQPNTLLRWSVKFRGDKNNAFNYVQPSKIFYNQYNVSEEDVYQTNETEGIAVKVDSIGSIVLEKADKSGWVYIGVVEDSASWYTSLGTPSRTYLTIDYRLYLEDKEKFLEWLDQQQFNYRGLGNPIPETDKLVVTSDVNKTEIVRFTTTNPDSFTLQKSLDVKGYFFKPNGFDKFLYYSVSGRIYEFNGVDNKKNIYKWQEYGDQKCFSKIEISDNNIIFGSYRDSCENPELKKLQNGSFSIQRFINYGKDAEDWILVREDKTLYRPKIKDKKWEDVTRCFKSSKIEKKSEKEEVQLISNLTSLVQDECLVIESKIFENLDTQPLTPQNSEEVVEQVSSSSASTPVANSSQTTTSSQTRWTFLENIASQEFAFDNIDGVVKEDENGFFLIDITANRLYFFEESSANFFRRYDVTECFSAIEVKNSHVNVGNFVNDSCPLINSSSSASSSISGSDDYHACKDNDGIINVKVPVEISCEEYRRQGAQTYVSQSSSQSSNTLPVEEEMFAR